MKATHMPLSWDKLLLATYLTCYAKLYIWVYVCCVCVNMCRKRENLLLLIFQLFFRVAVIYHKCQGEDPETLAFVSSISDELWQLFKFPQFRLMLSKGSLDSHLPSHYS